LASTQQFCTFFINKQFFAVPVQQVQEVIRYQEMTCVPLVPAASGNAPRKGSRAGAGRIQAAGPADVGTGYGARRYRGRKQCQRELDPGHTAVKINICQAVH
jgi:CheW-like protein